MRMVTSFKLAVIAIMLAAITPQSMEARTSGGFNPSEMNINHQTAQNSFRNDVITPSNILPATQANEKIVTKGASLNAVYIGSALLPIPTSTTPVYYSYSESEGVSKLTDPKSTTDYNVSAALDKTKQLLLTFKNLTVTNTFDKIPNLPHSGGYYSSAVTIDCDTNTFITLEGKNILAPSKTTGTTFALYSRFNIEITGSGSLKASGGTKEAIFIDENFTINLTGGSLTAEGPSGVQDPKGLDVTRKFTLKGTGSTTISSGKGTRVSSGIEAQSMEIALSGRGSLAVSAGTGGWGSYGLYLEGYGASNPDKDVCTITSGDVRIQGYTKAICQSEEVLVPILGSDLKVLGDDNYAGTSLEKVALPLTETYMETCRYFQAGTFDLKDATVEGIAPAYRTLDEAKFAVPVVKLGGITLTAGTDYTAALERDVVNQNENITITANPGGFYTGSLMIPINLVPNLVYIGNAYMPVPSKREAKAYYLYTEDANETDPLKGGTLTSKGASETNYNVSAYVDEIDGKDTLRITFKGLTVAKNHSVVNNLNESNLYLKSSAVRIGCSAPTIITLEGTNSLTDAAKASDMTNQYYYTMGLFSEGFLKIEGKDTLNVTANPGDAASGETQYVNCGVLVESGGLCVALNNGTLNAIAKGSTSIGSTCGLRANSIGDNAELPLTIEGRGTINASAINANVGNVGMIAYKTTVALTGGSLTIAASTATGAPATANAYGVLSWAADKPIDIQSGIVTMQGLTNVTKGLLPTIYDGAKITASTNYNGSNPASSYNASEIATYNYLKIGSDNLADATVTDIPDQAYTGSTIKPLPTVKLNGVTLVKDLDYTVEYGDNTEKGTDKGTVTIKPVAGSGYTGEKVVKFDITTAVIFIGSASVSIPDAAQDVKYYTYSEDENESDPLKGSTLTEVGEGEDYNVSVSMTEGKLNVTFNKLSVNKSSQYEIWIYYDDDAFDIKKVVAAARIEYNSGSTILTAKNSNDLHGANNVNIETNIGLYFSGVSEITGDGSIQAYGGVSHGNDKISIGIRSKGDLTLNLTGGNLLAVGGGAADLFDGYSYGITANGAGGLFVKGNGVIHANGIAGSGDIIENTGIVSSGNITIALTGGELTAEGDSEGMFPSGTTDIQSGIVTIKGNSSVTYEEVPKIYAGAKITASENFDGSNPVSKYKESDILDYKYLKIGSTDLADATVETIADQQCTGSAIEPEPLVKLNGLTLVKGTDYAVGYEDNIKPGAATITITPAANSQYTGKNTATFTILPYDFTKATVTGVENSYLYTGNQITPDFTVEQNGKTLVKDTDYEVSYGENTNPGTGTITITGKGFYKGTQTITFTILPVDLADATVTGVKKSYEHTGYQIKPDFTVELNGKTLEEGRDYTVTYGSNTNPGTGTITIAGMGIYVGEQTITFTINEEPTTDYAYINLPSVVGIKSDPVAGTYAITKGDSFTFTLTLEKGYTDSKPVVTVDHKVITPNAKGAYVISNITENKDIQITGVTTGIEGISAKASIWTSGHNLYIRTSRPQQLQVISIVGSVAILRNLPAGDTTISTLSSGIYIVRLTDGTIAKVIIR